jgi:hypothetical protein
LYFVRDLPNWQQILGKQAYQKTGNRLG